MASSDNAQNGHDRQSDLAVMDANEYKQKRRLERILDALDGVQDTADDAWSAYVAGEISREAYHIALHRAVRKAIVECYKLLIDHARSVDGGGRDHYWKGDPDEPLGVVDLVGEEVAHIDGLQDFFDAPTFFDRTLEERVERRNVPDTTNTRTVECTMPESVSYRAYLRLKEFLDDVHDMEISFEEMDDSLPNWGFEKEEEIPDDAVVL